MNLYRVIYRNPGETESVSYIQSYFSNFLTARYAVEKAIPNVKVLSVEEVPESVEFGANHEGMGTIVCSSTYTPTRK